MIESLNRNFKLAAAILCSGAMLALSACGSGPNKDSSDAIVVRISAPLSGQSAAYGQLAKGFEAYLKNINATGGVAGKKFDIKAFDNGESPDGGASTMLSILGDQPDLALVVGTTPVNASLKIVKAKQAKLPIFGFVNPRVIEASGVKNAYGMYPNYLNECYMDSKYLVEQYEAKNIAIVYEDDPVGQDAGKNCPAYGRALGAKVTAIPVSATTTDFNSIAASIKASGAKFVQVVAISPLMVKLQKAAERIGYKGQWMTFSSATYDSYIKLAGTSAEGTLISNWLTPLDEATEATKQFHADLSKYEPDSETYLGAAGWTLGAVVTKVLKESIAANDGAVPSSAKLNAAISSLDAPDGLGLSEVPLSYKDHASSPFSTLSILQIESGKLKRVHDPLPIPSGLPNGS